MVLEAFGALVAQNDAKRQVRVQHASRVRIEELALEQKERVETRAKRERVRLEK